MKRTLISLAALSAILVPSIAFAKPIIGPVTPVTAAVGQPVNLSATVSSAVPIQRCSLWVDLAEIGDMTVANGVASRSYTFSAGGARIAFVFCRDTSSGMSSGATTGITVSGALVVTPPLSTPAQTTTPPQQTATAISTPEPTTTQTPEQTSTAISTPETNTTSAPATTPVITTVSSDAGKILKAICPQSASADHPCHAVYYIGNDGKRHSFPNSRVYFTWYSNFDSVQEVAPDALSQYPLGTNVTYRAGVRMVKFTTDPKVYAVARGAVLRWIKTEALAQAFYGNDWNQKIDDIADAYYTNYTFGIEINSMTDYSPATELAHSTE